MAHQNQSVSPNAFTLPASDSGVSLNSGTATWHRTAVIIAAWVEILVGVSFLLVPNAQSQMIFAITPEGIGVAWARFAGVALIALGFACLPSSRTEIHRRAVQTLFIFNIAATIFFGWFAVATTFRGVVLWPVVIAHAILAIVLAPALKHAD